MVARLFKPVDIAPLVFLRIVGGALIAIECAGHALTEFRLPYVAATVHFSWPLTPWLAPGAPAIVYAHMTANVIAATLVALGCYYRAAAVALCVGLGTLLAMEQTAYINHTYLYTLFAGIFACIPANAAASVDVRRRPEIARDTAPAWCLYLLRFQIAVVYLFAGIAKIEPDWLHAMPVSMWLGTNAAYPLIGPLLAAPATAYAMSYGGLVFDLLIVPAMLCARTRRYAFATAAGFHLTNVVNFGIGTFPWFSLAATALFFPPQAFRELPFLGSALRPPATHGVLATNGSPPGQRALVAAALAVYVALQLAIPSRRFFLDGNPSWTEVGHTFAWRMMLRQKESRLTLRLHEPSTGKSWAERPAKYLLPRQVFEVSGDPEMIVQLARHIARSYAATGRTVEVRVDSFARLNGRPSCRLLRPDIDLAALPPASSVLDIVLPLEPCDR